MVLLWLVKRMVVVHGILGLVIGGFFDGGIMCLTNEGEVKMCRVGLDRR
ncbi:hypothetical protein ACFL49_01285 [Candidatus Omnitrophota bacterium]